MKRRHTFMIVLTVHCLIFTTGYSQNLKVAVQEPAGLAASTVVDTVYSPSLEGNLLGDPLWNYPDKPDGKLGYKKVVICHDDKTKKKV